MNDLEKEIALYLDGEMTPEQLLIFEEKINNDTQLQQDIATHKEMNSTYDEANWNTVGPTTKNQKISAYEAFLKSEEGKTIATSIKNAERAYFKTKPRSKVKKLLLYSASIAAVFVIVFFVISQLNTHDPQNLYAEYKNWNDLPSLTSRDSNTELAEAEKLFRQQKYKASLAIFTQYHQAVGPKDMNPQILTYMGVTQLELDQHETAIKTFETLLHSNTLDAPKANWYLALTYLKMNDPEKAKEILNNIIGDPGNDHYQNAKELIDELK